VAEVRRAVPTLLQPGAVAELYLPDQSGAGLRAGLYDDAHVLVHDATEWSGRLPAVFVSLNPLAPSATVTNRLHELIRPVRDCRRAEVVRRRWFPIDIDPRRPPNCSSTEQEHAAAFATANRIREWLAGLGWPEPLIADSGNGAHLLYRVNLPHDAASTRLIELGLAALALRFSDQRVEVDASVGDGTRLWKL